MSQQVVSSIKSKKSSIPTPFIKALASIEPFLDQLDPAHVYITHIDRHPPHHKKNIFLIPVLLNATIAGLLAWRLYAAVPVYWAILQTLLGYASSATVDVSKTTRGEQIWVLLKRTAMFALDFLISRFIAPWPLTFFFEQPANPVTWRWRLGFQKEEVVVRVSRGWGAEDLMKGVKKGQENAFFKMRILPAIDEQFMRTKTGYLMMDKSWDLDFPLMLDAHTLISTYKVQIESLNKLVLVNMEGVGWLSWQWATDQDVMEDRRKKVVAFKDELTKMGKESLFFKWMRMVEEERDADGGLSVQKQQKVAKRVEAAFQADGVDFEGLTRRVGGVEKLPADSK